MNILQVLKGLNYITLNLIFMKLVPLFDLEISVKLFGKCQLLNNYVCYSFQTSHTYSMS